MWRLYRRYNRTYYKSGEKLFHRQVAELIRRKYPSLIFNTDLSGVRLTIGQAREIKYLRSNKGFPDIVIYEPNKKYHGLFLELKTSCPYKQDGKLKKDKHIQEQAEVMEKLREKGYYATFVWDLKQVDNIINKYVNNEL